jgi:hypothetical protein
VQHHCYLLAREWNRRARALGARRDESTSFEFHHRSGIGFPQIGRGCELRTPRDELALDRCVDQRSGRAQQESEPPLPIGLPRPLLILVALRMHDGLGQPQRKQIAEFPFRTPLRRSADVQARAAETDDRIERGPRGPRGGSDRQEVARVGHQPAQFLADSKRCFETREQRAWLGASGCSPLRPVLAGARQAERAFDQDLQDVDDMLERGLIEPAQLVELYESIEPDLFRSPRSIPRRSGPV